MAVVAISHSILTDIADAIRSKNGQETLYKPSEMPDAIEAISTPTGTISITANDTYDVTEYASAEVNVSGGAVLGTKSITENGTYNASSDSLDGYSSVTVNVPEVVIELENLGWEVGAVDGGTGQQYQNKKLNNTARLRGIYLVSTANIPFNMSANWGNGEWTIMVAQYGSDGLGKTQFTTVLTSDGQLPISPYLAFVVRHSDGTTAMNVSDINTIKPKLTLDTSRLT